MVNLIYVFALSFISTITYCSQNDMDDWIDAESELSKLQKEAHDNFIQANKIIKQIKEIHQKLYDAEADSINDKEILSTIRSQIQKLYELNSLSETKKEEYNLSINRISTFSQQTKKNLGDSCPFFIVSNSLVVGEILRTDIFRKAQELGLYPEGYPNNL